MNAIQDWHCLDCGNTGGGLAYECPTCGSRSLEAIANELRRA